MQSGKVCEMAEKEDSSDSDGLIVDDNVIRIQLKKSTHKKWELRTRNLSPGIKFPTIQLFDAEGNLLVETNDENISIKSLDCNEPNVKSSQSLREKDYKHTRIIRQKYVRKHNTISGDKVYTRAYSNPVEIKNNNDNYNEYNIIKDNCTLTNIPSNLTIDNNLHNLRVSSLDTTPFHSEGPSKASSYKSSDDETCQDLSPNKKNLECRTGTFENDNCSSRYSENTSSISIEEYNGCDNDKSERQDNVYLGLQASQSFDATRTKEHQKSFYNIQRSKSNAIYSTPPNKVSFLNTYLKSLPIRASPNPDWFTSRLRQTTPRNNSWKTNQIESVKIYSRKNIARCCELKDKATEKDFMNISTDEAADCEIKKRLKMYRRGISEIESRCATSCIFTRKRRHSVSGAVGAARGSSSSESVDEADVVLYRLKRRILKNKLREKRRGFGQRTSFDQHVCKDNESEFQENWRNAGGGAFVRSRLAMGSNISQHSAKGLKGRRARSSGDLCNGETKSQTESSVCGSVVGDVMGWNRSLPNHLDGNRHLADYSRVNNNYGDFNTYRSHPKGGRGLRYRVSKSGSNAEPVWKLQDPGFDQGYGSERSPEEDFIPPIVPPISIEQYEAELRTVYPFITDENTFTVVVEKDGRGLGMSVCGGGLVRIRRLYPPQPAWRTGRLAPKDLLLSANGVPLAGLSTYEALEVLRTASARVELRVCRAPTDLLESVTPPEPPTPPARTPHPQHLPLDPLNCHPLHARLSQTTSSATSSSEGRGRRDASPEAGRPAQDLDLPELEQHLPVYDIQYGDDGSVEFDILMTKVNGSLGFTLRKEDHSALGHYVRALVREPALSDGRVQPGDRIVAVNDTAMSSMSHAEAVSFLRACGSEVRLRLYRDHAATPLSPLSPMSPKEDGHTDSDAPFSKPKPPLRAEAVSMLCDLAARRLAPDTTATSPAPSPRRARKLTKDHHCERTHDVSSFATLETHTKPDSFKRSETGECPSFGTEQCTIDRRATLERSASASNMKMLTVHNKTRIEDPKRRIPLTSPTAPPTTRKQKLSLTVPPHGYELNNLDNDQLDAPNLYQENITLQRFAEPAFPIDSDEPVSMPTELSTDERFKHSCPAYQSAVLHTTTSESTSDGLKDDANGFKKWKAAAPLPANDRKPEPPSSEVPPKLQETKEIDNVQKENVKSERQADATNTEPTIVTVELNRGWNSRLGFSVRSHPESAQSYISAVHGDSAAARDGRLRRGDVILQVNDENVTSMKTPEVIDLLRLLRGSICITVLRPANV